MKKTKPFLGRGGELHYRVVLAYFSINVDCRMESPKHVVVEATKWTCCVQMLCLCGFKWLLEHVLDWLCDRIWIGTFRTFLSDLCANPCEQSVDFLVCVALYIIVPTRTFSWCLLPTVNPLCCPTHIFHTKLQANNSKPCAWFRPFQANIYT